MNMSIDFLAAVFQEHASAEAIVWKDKVCSYDWLTTRIAYWQSTIQEQNIRQGSVVVMEGDFSPNAVALFLALADHRCILVPLTTGTKDTNVEFADIAQAEIAILFDANDDATFRTTDRQADHEMYTTLRGRENPGLVLFSSGSTGKSKATVHDLERIFEKFKVRRQPRRMISFLLYDHMGGLNTMLYALSNGGCLVTVQDRNPHTVLQAVEQHRVDLLPASPTFLNLVLLSDAYKQCDLGTLKTISYGTEPMPQSTLDRLHRIFPAVDLLQTYGLSEVGVLRSKSKSSNSLWVKLGGEGFETRIVDGILQIKAHSAMLGYLNAPSPFTDDGWLITGDQVEMDGEYMKILGRTSEFINVGGDKVFPTEIESVLQMMDGVEDVIVSGKKNPITGQIVAARVKLTTDETLSDFRKRMWQFCKDKLLKFKIPQDVRLVEGKMYGDRFKKMRHEWSNN